MKKFIILLMALFSTLNIVAQNIQIKGSIIDKEENRPVEFANIALYTIDSTFVSGCSSNGKGLFKIDKIPVGDYYINISYIGYEASTIILSALSRNTDLGNIILEPASVNIGDVEVTAAGIVNSRDRYIAYPSKKQLQISSNGIELLQNAMLPRLSVDPVMNKITVSGGDAVQLRINGVKATIEEIKSLQPENIIRIEYHDNPGLRYGGATAVLDYITRRHESGGNIYGNLMNSFVTKYGNDQIGARINHKKSEFSLNYMINYRDYYNTWRTNEEQFNFGDGTVFTRSEKGLPGRLKFNEYWLIGGYNYVDPDKHFFNMTAIFWNFKKPINNYFSDLSVTSKTGTEILTMKDFNTDYQKVPYLDLYYQYTIDKKQLFLVNIVSTYSNANNSRLYQESREEELISDYFSGVKSNRYSVIGEGIYENNLEIGKLSIGLKHLQAYTDNMYLGDYETKTKMRESESSIYAEFQGKINKLNYTLGIRGTRTYVNQLDVNDYQTFSFLPIARLAINPTDNSSLRYSFSAGRQLPSLAQLSAVEQRIDSLQIRRGNPELKPNMAYTNSLSYDYRKSNLGFSLFTLYTYAHHPTMDITLLKNNTFIRTYEMYKNFQRINMEASFSYKLFKESLQLSLNGGMNHYISNGYSTHYKYTDWYYSINAAFTYKKWLLNGSLYREKNRFSGSEYIQKGEQGHSVQLKYNQNKYSIGVGVKNPFSNDFRSGYENLSLIAPYQKENYINDLSQMYYITFSWNLNFGRKYEGSWKKTYNSDSNNSILEGKK